MINVYARSSDRFTSNRQLGELAHLDELHYFVTLFSPLACTKVYVRISISDCSLNSIIVRKLGKAFFFFRSSLFYLSFDLMLMNQWCLRDSSTGILSSTLIKIVYLGSRIEAEAWDLIDLRWRSSPQGHHCFETSSMRPWSFRDLFWTISCVSWSAESPHYAFHIIMCFSIPRAWKAYGSSYSTPKLQRYTYHSWWLEGVHFAPLEQWRRWHYETPATRFHRPHYTPDPMVLRNYLVSTINENHLEHRMVSVDYRCQWRYITVMIRHLFKILQEL